MKRTQPSLWSAVKPAALAALVALSLAAPASAQPLRFRTAAAALPFTPLHSYVSGERGQEVLFFGGISGQGMHSIAQAQGIVAFPLPVFNDRIYMLDQATSTLFSGVTTHLSATLRDRLRVTNAAEIQFGDTLYIYGGYGPIGSGTEWYTKASVLAVDLAAVSSALRAGTPVPASAFTIMPSAAAQVAGVALAKVNADRFALVGGSNFEGDYGLGLNPGGQPFSNTYADAMHIFDRTVSMTTPVQTFSDPYWLHRRDLNVLPVTLPAGPGTRGGVVLATGVFNGPGPWEEPAHYGDGDAAVTVHDTYVQKMNQYEAPHASFYAAGSGQNRIVIFGGLSYQIFVAGQFFYDFLVPWVRDVTEQTFTNGAFVPGSEKIVGVTTLPTTNARLIYRPNMPRSANGQVLLDMLPHNEHLLGRIIGGLSAEYPAPEPPTFASSNVYNVYVAVGVRGDVTKDGVVNFADLNAVLSQFGQSGPLFTLSADLNLDGVVNFADLNVVLSNFGSNTPG